jgi:hypothetical protein
MPSDIEIYCACIERVRYHASVADTVLAGNINTGHDDLNAERLRCYYPSVPL